MTNSPLVTQTKLIVSFSIFRQYITQTLFRALLYNIISRWPYISIATHVQEASHYCSVSAHRYSLCFSQQVMRTVLCIVISVSSMLSITLSRGQKLSECLIRFSFLVTLLARKMATLSEQYFYSTSSQTETLYKLRSNRVKNVGIMEKEKTNSYHLKCSSLF